MNRPKNIRSSRDRSKVTSTVQEKTRAAAAPRKPKNGAVSSPLNVDDIVRLLIWLKQLVLGRNRLLLPLLLCNRCDLLPYAFVVVLLTWNGDKASVVTIWSRASSCKSGGSGVTGRAQSGPNSYRKTGITQLVLTWRARTRIPGRRLVSWQKLSITAAIRYRKSNFSLNLVKELTHRSIPRAKMRYNVSSGEDQIALLPTYSIYNLGLVHGHCSAPRQPLCFTFMQQSNAFTDPSEPKPDELRQSPATSVNLHELLAAGY